MYVDYPLHEGLYSDRYVDSARARHLRVAAGARMAVGICLEGAEFALGHVAGHQVHVVYVGGRGRVQAHSELQHTDGGGAVVKINFAKHDTD